MRFMTPSGKAVVVFVFGVNCSFSVVRTKRNFFLSANQNFQVTLTELRSVVSRIVDSSPRNLTHEKFEP